MPVLLVHAIQSRIHLWTITDVIYDHLQSFIAHLLTVLVKMLTDIEC